MEGKRTHRRCRSEGGAGAALAHWGALQPDVQPQDAEYVGAAHMRTVSLDTSASQFMQSLALHDARASQSQVAAFDANLAADQSTSGRRGHAAHAAVEAWPSTAEPPVTAGSKRSHESSKSSSRSAKDSMQQDGKKESMHQHKHSFTPALPAVEEMTTEDAFGNDDRDDDDDEDYDSDTPTARRTSGSRSRARRGGYNGRSENELLLLDPKRVKRILANRQSAARSKERRLNYTMQLEGKLQSLSQEVDKLNAQLEGLQGRGKALLQARGELEKQVETLQQQLSQTTAENQALVQELFGLQRSVGLPQQVPQADAPPAAFLPGHQQQAATAAAPAQYDPAMQHHASQQHDQQQQYTQWRQYNGTAGYATYGSSAAPPAAAVEASQLSRLQYQQQQQQQQQKPKHSRRGSSNSSIGYQPAADAAEAGRHSSGLLAAPAAAPAGPAPAAGIPPLPPNGRSPAAAAVKPVSTVFAGQPGSPRISSPPPSAAAAAARVASPALTSSVAAAASPLGSEAVVAADVLLMDASVEAIEADMANADDLDMLSALLGDSPMRDTAAAAQPQQDAVAPVAEQPLPMVDQAAAAASLGRRHAATHRQPAAVASFGPTNTVLGLNGLNSNVLSQHQAAAAAAAVAAAAAASGPHSWSAQSSPGAGILAPGLPVFDRPANATNGPINPSGFTPPASTGLNPAPAFRQNSIISGAIPNPRVLCSPAFSDPLGEGGFADDASSGSLGGLTPNTRHHRSSDSSGAAVAGATRLPAPALGPWQQQLQQQTVPAVSPHTPAHVAAAGSAAFSTHAAGAVDPAAAAAMPQHGGPISHHTHTQQQLHAGALGPPAALLQDTALINFTMGANPAAHHRRSASYGSAVAQHHRSASTGSMTGMGWPGSWTEAAAVDRNHWSVQSYGMFAGSSVAAPAAAPGMSVSQGPGPGLPHQQQQYMAGNSSSIMGDPAAAGPGHHRAARLSAPSLGQIAGFNALADASYGGTAGTISNSGSDRLTRAMHDMHSNSSRQQQQQHRRSYSHAGTYAAALYGAASSGDQLQQLEQIHPAALGPGDAATAAAMPAFGQLGRASGNTAAEHVPGSSRTTRTVTTCSTSGRR